MLKQYIDKIVDAGPNNPIIIPDSWTQGRTAYGGFSSALAYTVACNCTKTKLPPLRSAQINFVSPLAGHIYGEASVIRQGKSTSFIEARLIGGHGPGLICQFIFSKDRETPFHINQPVHHHLPPIPDEQSIKSGPPQFFTSQMQFSGPRMTFGGEAAHIAKWMRLTNRAGLDPFTELLCIGDALPPAIMAKFDNNKPVSSVNWQLNIFTSTPNTKRGWWLLESEAEWARAGISSQKMKLFNSEGQQILSGTQLVAYF